MVIREDHDKLAFEVEAGDVEFFSGLFNPYRQDQRRLTFGAGMKLGSAC